MTEEKKLWIDEIIALDSTARRNTLHQGVPDSKWQKKADEKRKKKKQKEFPDALYEQPSKKEKKRGERKKTGGKEKEKEEKKKTGGKENEKRKRNTRRFFFSADFFQWCARVSAHFAAWIWIKLVP